MIKRLLLVSLVVSAACGDDDGNSPLPDSGPHPTCTTATVGEITTYPGQFTGTTLGGGADLTAPEDTCSTQTEGAWFDPLGEDVVIRLGGLTAGTAYLVTLTTEDDLSFYVTSDCPPASGEVGACLNFTDVNFTNEQGAFVATGTEHYLVIDASDDPSPPKTGQFTVEVAAAACTEETEATDCASPTPFCVDFTCVQCATSFDCSGDTPVCSPENTCVAGPSTCTGDDVNDTTAPGDDAPNAATMLATPTAATPTVVNGAICSSPDTEEDWYQVALTGDVGIELEFTGATYDLDVYLLDDLGGIVDAGIEGAGVTEAFRTTGLAAGTYYVVVNQYRPEDTAEATPYTLRLSIPECETDFECTTPASPVCGAVGRCEAGPDDCMGDDQGDNNNADDGPVNARDLTTTATRNGSICAVPGEADWYKVTVAAGEGLDIALSWTGTSIDLDPYVFDATGRLLGMSFYVNPENVALTYLPAGTYYIRVEQFADAVSTTSTSYTITATQTAAQTCTSSADCAAAYSTQLYRGDCAAGVCQFIAAGSRANGVACDSGDDCMSGTCSYIAFESDAQDSVCTTSCTTSADCAAVGTGLTCTTGFQTNLCVPACETNLECGALTNRATIDTGEPWDYLTCTAATGVCAP